MFEYWLWLVLETVQGMAWPAWLQPYVEVVVVWISWALTYIDLNYLEVTSLSFCFLIGCENERCGPAGSNARMLKHLFGYLVSVPRLLSVAVPTRHPSAGGLRPLPGVGLSVRSVEPMVRLRYE